MTSPIPPEVAAELEETALALEQAAAIAVTSTLAAEVSEAVTDILRAFVTAPGQLVRDTVRRVFGGIRPAMRELAAAAARDGLVLGLEQGETVARARGGRPGQLSPPRDGELIKVVNRIDIRAQATLDDAVHMAQVMPMDTMADVNVVMGKGSSAVNGGKADARWIVNRSLGDGVTEVARSLGWNVMWVAERNACLHCLAYAGYVTEPDEDFPAGLTFGDKPLKLPPVQHPPLHPNCRCRIEPYDGEAGPPPVAITALDPPALLAKEARRSVLRGLTDYASTPASLRAADRLVRAGAALPKTVVARAARDVARKSFTARPK